MFRTRNDHPKKSLVTGVSMTQQSFKTEVDIHEIVSRAQRTGVLGNPYQSFKASPLFGDFTKRTVNSLQAALNKLNEAERLFYELPSEERKKFNNDPRNLLLHIDELVANMREEDVKVHKDSGPVDGRSAEPAVTPSDASSPSPAA